MQLVLEMPYDKNGRPVPERANIYRLSSDRARTFESVVRSKQDAVKGTCDLAHPRPLWPELTLAADAVSVWDQEQNFGLLAACAALGALLPDLDAPESKIKHLEIPGTQIRPFVPVSGLVTRTSQHRGLLHSLMGLAMGATLSGPAVLWVGWPPVASLLMGYLSHLLLDFMTKSGILWLFPSRKRFYLLPRLMRVSTGSLAEEIIMLSSALLLLFLLLEHV